MTQPEYTTQDFDRMARTCIKALVTTSNQVSPDIEYFLASTDSASDRIQIVSHLRLKSMLSLLSGMLEHLRETEPEAFGLFILKEVLALNEARRKEAQMKEDLR